MGSWLRPGLYFLDYGPMQMTLSAFCGKEPLGQEIMDAAMYAKYLLAELAPCLRVAKLPAGEIKQCPTSPEVLAMMIDAVKRCPDPSLTPMAAVAGSIADKVADFLVQRGATKVMINNGGDIALRLAEGESVKVGITSDLNSRAVSHIIEVESVSQVGGIATSGLGGRGFTKGIASAVVVLGVNCRLADACATLVANHTFSPDPEIKQVRAEKLDPDTDICGHLVTAALGRLQPKTWQQALHNGLTQAREVVEQGIIYGAVIFAGGQLAAVPERLLSRVLPVSDKN
jgi:ApbE superfamily uncharacterized protein (UPF0280 family)